MTTEDLLLARGLIAQARAESQEWLDRHPPIGTLARLLDVAISKIDAPQILELEERVAAAESHHARVLQERATANRRLFDVETKLGVLRGSHALLEKRWAACRRALESIDAMAHNNAHSMTARLAEIRALAREAINAEQRDREP